LTCVKGSLQRGPLRRAVFAALARGNRSLEGDVMSNSLKADSLNGRQETSLERLDRNLVEMTGELRVVITGVQVLFAFLLIVPFNSGFSGIGPFERGVYFVTLLCAALAAVCTIAPSAWHRVLFRCDDKRNIVFNANRLVIIGLVFLALAMCGSLLLVATKLFGLAVGVPTTVLASVPFALLWFALPLRRRRELSRRMRQDRPNRSVTASRDDPRIQGAPKS
jgi:Family of unknown function (DUF6328)